MINLQEWKARSEYMAGHIYEQWGRILPDTAIQTHSVPLIDRPVYTISLDSVVEQPSQILLLPANIIKKQMVSIERTQARSVHTGYVWFADARETLRSADWVLKNNGVAYLNSDAVPPQLQGNRQAELLSTIKLTDSQLFVLDKYQSASLSMFFPQTDICNSDRIGTMQFAKLSSEYAPQSRAYPFARTHDHNKKRYVSKLRTEKGDIVPKWGRIQSSAPQELPLTQLPYILGRIR